MRVSIQEQIEDQYSDLNYHLSETELKNYILENCNEELENLKKIISEKIKNQRAITKITGVAESIFFKAKNKESDLRLSTVIKLLYPQHELKILSKNEADKENILRYQRDSLIQERNELENEKSILINGIIELFNFLDKTTQREIFESVKNENSNLYNLYQSIYSIFSKKNKFALSVYKESLE